MQDVLIEILNKFGYLGIGSLIFIENVFPPIPSEVILMFGGFMTTYSQMNVWLVILAATIGSYAGASLLYLIGRLLSKERLIKIVSGKVGKIIRLKPEHIEKADGWFNKCGFQAVFICRCVPVVRSLISIPAGMSKMSFGIFSALTIGGSAMWNIVLTWMGRVTGSAWESYIQYFDCYSNIVVIALIAAALIGVVVYMYNNKKRKTVNKIAKIKTKHMAPGRLIALGFFSVIFIGAVLLFTPITHNSGVIVSFTDALFTSTSAVCVTGLIAVDTADTYNFFGQIIVALLIQIGGLGITSIGVGFIIISGRKINIRERIIAKESLNYFSLKGILSLLTSVLKMTLCFEAVGAILSFFVFSKNYPIGIAIWISIFHSIAAFNNSGFDILGGYQNLIPYQDNIMLNMITCGLIIFGGLGFFVIRELYQKHSFKKFSLHSKVVITMTATLLIVGTLLLKATDNITWLEAFFTSTSSRTAGFSTFSIGTLSNAGLLVLIILMFVGASPGSTGGGIKTTTFFILIQSVLAASTNKPCGAFKRRFPAEVIRRAFVITILSLSIVIFSTMVLSICEPQTDFIKLLFESVSAFGTVGLSTGITPDLCNPSKWILTLTMYLGRLGPLTAASLWIYNQDSAVFRAEESITI